jgi:hypothetical protein
MAFAALLLAEVDDQSCSPTLALVLSHATLSSVIALASVDRDTRTAVLRLSEARLRATDYYAHERRHHTWQVVGARVRSPHRRSTLRYSDSLLAHCEPPEVRLARSPVARRYGARLAPSLRVLAAIYPQTARAAPLGWPLYLLAALAQVVAARPLAGIDAVARVLVEEATDTCGENGDPHKLSPTPLSASAGGTRVDSATVHGVAKHLLSQTAVGGLAVLPAHRWLLLAECRAGRSLAARVVHRLPERSHARSSIRARVFQTAVPVGAAA